MSTEWRDVKGYEGLYSVSSDGEVLSIKRGKVLKPFSSGNGYLKVSLSKSNRNVLVHRLVCSAFYPDTSGENVNHVNGDKTDNRSSNLEWCSRSHNILHAHSIGLMPVKGDRVNSKLTTEYVAMIRELRLVQGLTYKFIGEMFGVSNTQAHNIVKNKQWKEN